MHLTILTMINFLFSKKFILLAAILIAGYLFLTNNPLVQADIPSSPTIDSTEIWWDSNYVYRKEIVISSSNAQVVDINHAQLIIDGKANKDGSDLKVIAQKNDLTSEITTDIADPDSLNTKVKFEKLNDSSLRYFLYYGNKNATSDSVLGTTSIKESSNTTLGREETPTIALISFKKWILKENNQDITFRIESKELIDSQNQIFAILNNNTTQKLSVKFAEGSVNINPTNIPAGTNEIYIVASVGGKQLRSNSVSFNYSLPLYVTWTIDWEGTIPEMKYLDMMETLSDEYTFPMTQYFNPRIYTTIRYTDSQKKAASDWIKKRYLLGDDIGMHMHMQHDMVEEAGVKAKYNAETWDKGISGYDTPSTAYNYDEYLKLLKWGKEEIKTQLKRYSDFDLPELQGFRAGGWFANIDNLKAMQDAGFIYDTSGRVSFQIGGNEMAQPWNLQTTTQPYYISELNQNLSTAPTLDLLEIPNNGSDSYWSNEQELISNFYENYNPGEILEVDKLVVYLSHPDWFYIDDPKLRILFEELNKYRIDFDNGPVKFVTMREYLEKSEYIKGIAKD